MIIETCPKCGADLLPLVYATNPPITAWSCPQCGWHYEQKPEPIERVPFTPQKEADNG